MREAALGHEIVDAGFAKTSALADLTYPNKVVLSGMGCSAIFHIGITLLVRESHYRPSNYIQFKQREAGGTLSKNLWGGYRSLGECHNPHRLEARCSAGCNMGEVY